MKTVIVYGPKACGKTTNAAELAKYFGLSQTIELDENARTVGGLKIPDEGALVLTYRDQQTVENLARVMGVTAIAYENAAEALKIRTLSTARRTLDEAIDEAGIHFPESPLGSLCFDGETAETLQHGLFQAQRLCHGLAAKSGWWADRKTGEPFTVEQVNIAEKLCLIHSEISEAMEGARKNLMDDKLSHRKMLEVELAGALIRILDLGGFLNLDIAGATIEKLAFNQSRADHKLENRNAEGGKAF